MKYTATLTAINSERDRSGNCYWAFRYIDHETGNTVVGQISGGESNIYGILRHWGVSDDWDRSVLWNVQEIGKREFKDMVQYWPYAGCASAEIAKFIKDGLTGKHFAVVKG